MNKPCAGRDLPRFPQCKPWGPPLPNADQSGPPRLLHLKLLLHQFLIQGMGRQQLFVGPLAGDPAVFNDDDRIRIDDRGKAMGNNEGRPSLHQVFQRLLHEAFRFAVQVGRGFIQQKQLRVAQKGPRDGDSLPLSPGKFDAPFPHFRVIPLRQFLDEFAGIGQPGRFLHFFLGDGFFDAVTNIFPYRAGDDRALLGDVADGAAPAVKVEGFDVFPADRNHAFRRFVKPFDQGKNGRLPAPARPDKSEGFSGFGGKIDRLQRHFPLLIGKRHIVERKRLSKVDFFFPAAYFPFHVQHFHDPLRRPHRFLESGKEGSELAERHDNLEEIDDDRDEGSGRHRAGGHPRTAVADDDDDHQHDQHRHERRYDG